MTTRERLNAVFSFKEPDRLPVIEWASWWDTTIDCWRKEGLPATVKTSQDIAEYFDLDIHRQFWMPTLKASCPKPGYHGASLLDQQNHNGYEKLKPHIFPDGGMGPYKDAIMFWENRQRMDGIPIWLTLEGFFWFPRKIMGIESHLYNFYDEPDLMHRINNDMLAYNMSLLEGFCELCMPDFMTIAEDMSYNNGPMISKDLFDEFMAPYYRPLVKKIKDYGIKLLIDTDGAISQLVPWYEELGVTGFLPLERQSGVDVSALRKKHPGLMMLGGFDKTVMHLGEAAMRYEFERLLPVIKQKGFIPSCDHQTPPQVSLRDYKLYVTLLKEYCSI